ncbi:autotransporter domain-containing protein [Neorhizobium sp. P12A]|uniref:autotransporter outer membrane beta-barrel domain-containing protein n=1 Tax=Neorhizobium sp. P12A TaxID=2268027 RepID=UPI0011EFD3A4|nr:autotransporter domain-containing protein [Neorhizobium sp. P12A]KAA0689538.1 autotransporter domain-containing protein [Neorhizobium sp. P12A]
MSGSHFARVRGTLILFLLSSVAPIQALAGDVIIGSGVTNPASQTLQDQDTLTVNTGGALDTATGDPAITWNDSATSNVSIVNSGTIRSQDDRAIRSHSAHGGTISVTNNSGATIEADDDAFQINGDMPGLTVNVTNAGTIVSHGGQALDFGDVASSDAMISVHNLLGGLISADADDAIHVDGGTVSIVNDGTISSVLSESRGIDLGNYADTGSVTINNNAGATIESNDDAIRIDGDDDGSQDTSSGQIVINNAGLIVSRNDGQAIDFDHVYSPVSNVTINNLATGVIQANNADAVRPGEGGTVNNAGTIISYAPDNTAHDPDDDTSNDGVDFQAHAGTVNNYSGGLISGSRHGITSDTDVTVTNYEGGTIIGRNGSGVGSDGNGTVTNYGTITGAIDDNSVNGDGDGVDIDGFATIKNYGTIQGIGAKGEKDGSINTSEGVATGGGVIQNLSSNAVISGATNGILVDDSNAGNAPNATQITNMGTIRGQAGFGIKLIGVQNDTITNSGLIEGDNGLAIDMGDGNDTLNIQAGSRIVGTIDGGAGTDTVTLNGSGTFAGAQNFEFLDVQSGNWILTGSQSYSGGVSLAGGTLSVDGTLDATLNVGAGSVLNGNGTLGSAVIAGTIAPGHSIGRLNFTGTYTQLAGSNYLVEANEAGQSDYVDVTGTATIAGGVTAKPFPLFRPDTRYTILTANGGVTGTYDTLTYDPHVFLDFALAYDPNNVYLDVTRNDVAFADVATTRNQARAATGIESLGSGNGVYDLVANATDAQQADQDFEALSGEIHASAKTALLEDSHFIRDAMASRLKSAFGAVQAPGTVKSAQSGDRFAMWGQAFGSWGSTDGNGNAADLDRNIGGFLVGGDAAIGDNWRIGMLTGYSRSTFDVDARASSGHSDDYHVGVYGGGQWGALGFSTGAAYTWHDMDTHRSVRSTDFNQSLTADYDADTAQIFGEVNYDVKVKQIDLQPFANLAYVNLHTDSFHEKGGSAALSGGSSSDNLTFTTLGVRASTDVSLGSNPASLHGSLGWRHALGDTTTSSSLAFAGGDAFSIDGVPVARDALAVDAGVDVNLSKQATFGVSYSGQIAGKSSTNGVKANIAVKF